MQEGSAGGLTSNGVEYRGGMVELWLGTPSRSIFRCLKPQCLGNSRAAGAFRGCGTGDEGSRSGEAKLRGDFPSTGLFILGAEEVSALLLLLEPEGRTSKLLPIETGHQQQTGADMIQSFIRFTAVLFFYPHMKHSLKLVLIYMSIHSYNHRSAHEYMHPQSKKCADSTTREEISSPTKSAAQRPLIFLRSLC